MQRLDQAMAAVKGRTHRRGVSNAVLLQARVQPERHAKAHAAASALGIPLAAYIDGLLAHEEVDEQGRPVWWSTPAVPADQEELPLKTA